MSNAVVSRLGQDNLAGDAKELFLKVFAGEVLTAYEETKVIDSLTRTRVITSGKSAQFPATFNAGTEYHTPGAEILGGQIAHAEVVISIDDMLIAPIFVADIDEAMNHYEVRGTYSTEMGRALALAKDKNQARKLVQAARGPALFTGDTGGQQIVDADALTNGASLADSIWLGKQRLEEADVPVDAMPVHAVFKPAQWYLLAQETTKVINRDVGGQANYSQGTLTLIGGVNVHKANALPWGVNDSANADVPAAHRVDMSNTAGVVFVENAIATVQLIGMGLRADYDPRRMGTLMVGRYAVGHGTLRTKAAVEIATA